MTSTPMPSPGMTAMRNAFGFIVDALPYRGRAIKAKRLARPPATTMTSTLTALTAGVAPSRIWPYM